MHMVLYKTVCYSHPVLSALLLEHIVTLTTFIQVESAGADLEAGWGGCNPPFCLEFTLYNANNNAHDMKLVLIWLVGCVS